MGEPSFPSLEATVKNKIKGLGCCKLCSLRFTGETNPEEYKKLYEINTERDSDDEKLPPKSFRRNPCIACLGLLQLPTSSIIMDKILEELNASDYDSDTFSVALTLPVVYQLRAHSIWILLVSGSPDFVQSKFPLGCVTISVKDVWKWLFTSVIEKKINKKCDPSSDFSVEVSISYEDNDNECSCLFKMLPKLFNRRQKPKNNSQQEIFSRKGIEEGFRTITVATFHKHYPGIPAIPSFYAEFGSLTLKHKSIFVGGRYNKWSRTLPQTPWIIGGERKMESSVQEYISEPLKKITKAEGSKFAASGREDVDVRTLGRGRPFSIELINPKRVKFDFDQIRQLEKEINRGGRTKISIRDLQLVTRESLVQLKTGEEEKTKEYNAYCIVTGPYPPELEKLHEKAPITLNQSTPVRVLHRRPVAVRQKTINWFKVKPVSEGKTPDDYSYFTLRMNAQAGTYIKEFIHGDLGRTTPSLGYLLGRASVDILALDVEEVKLDWPPPVDYSVKKDDDD